MGKQHLLPLLRVLARGPLAALLLALTLAPRLAIPAGFMPVPEASGGHFTVSICNGTMAGATMVLPARPGHPAPAGDHGTAPCPYAVMALAWLGAPPPVANTPPALVASPAVSAEILAAPNRAPWHSPPATGPPALI